MLIKLSCSNYVKYDRINSCSIYKQDDECWYVKWSTDDGDVVSDALTGRVAACNYVEEVADEIINHHREFMFGGQSESD